MRSSSVLVWVRTALLGLVTLGLGAACGGNGDTGSGTGCTAGAQQSCDCKGGKKGIQVCNDDGKSFGACDCGDGSGGNGGNGGGAGGLGPPTCGDGVEQAGECDPGEFSCPQDCMSGAGGTGGGTGGDPCTGHVYYAAMVPDVPSVWVEGGLDSLAAGDLKCQKLNMGADHVCDYTELLAAEAAGEFKKMTAGTNAWVQRSTEAMVDGKPSKAGPGGNCNQWKYSTNHAWDGEWIEFITDGQATYHLDNDTAGDGTDTSHAQPAALECGGVNGGKGRAIFCCYQKCGS